MIKTLIENKIILIIASSGRLLAKMANNAGYDVVVIDCFSDTDAQASSLECIKVKNLSVEQVKPAFFYLKSRYTLSYAMYGSGFELYFSCLEYLYKEIKLLGNIPNVFSAIQNKAHFFTTLKQLKIPFPETSFQRPKCHDDWLVKPMKGEGGIGIKKHSRLAEPSDPSYWQRFINGIPMSVLFIADGTGFEICGFHKQLIISASDNDFIFSGIISQPQLDNEIKDQLTEWVAKLVVAFSLKGLNSLDFIMKNNRCYVLEVNPRPSASMQLYDDELINNHINGCLQKPSGKTPNQKKNTAYQLVFAETDTMFIKEIQWPEWVFDRPQIGSLIHIGQPICSIIACEKSEQQVLDKLLLKQYLVKQLLK